MLPGSPCRTPKTTESALERQIKLAERKHLVRQCLVGIRTSVHDEPENLVRSLLWDTNGTPSPNPRPAGPPRRRIQPLGSYVNLLSVADSPCWDLSTYAQCHGYRPHNLIPHQLGSGSAKPHTS